MLSCICLIFRSFPFVETAVQSMCCLNDFASCVFFLVFFDIQFIPYLSSFSDIYLLLFLNAHYPIQYEYSLVFVCAVFPDADLLVLLDPILYQGNNYNESRLAIQIFCLMSNFCSSVVCSHFEYSANCKSIFFSPFTVIHFLKGIYMLAV